MYIYVKIYVHLHEDLCTFTKICRRVLLRMKNISDKFIEKKKKCFIFKDFFFQKITSFMT